MAEQARVTSVEALEAFRSNLIVFLTDARRSVDDTYFAVGRMRQWLQNDQRVHWEGQLRQRKRALDLAEQELFSARLSGLRDSLIRQEEAVRKGRRAVGEAEDKLRKVKKWNQNFPGLVDPLIKSLQPLRDTLDHDLTKALAYLVHAQRTLEAYAEGPPPEAAPPAPLNTTTENPS